MKILLASDGSPNSLDATRFVLGLALENEIEVHLVQVLPEDNAVGLDSLNPCMPAWKTSENQEKIREVSERHVDMLGALSDNCIAVSMSNPRGDARFCILAEAEAHDVDLIVMGARGHSMLERVFLGSVSEYVVHHANCSVVVVRPGEDTQTIRAPKNVLVAYDCSLGAYEAVQELLKTEWPPETQVNVLSVASIGFPFEGEPNTEDESSEVTKLRRAGESLAGMIARDVPNTSNQVVQSRHAGDAIVRIGEETKSDLIVVGETGQGIIGQWIIGSTTKFVLNHASSSVWISRHHRKAKPKSEVADEKRSTSSRKATTS